MVTSTPTRATSTGAGPTYTSHVLHWTLGIMAALVLLVLAAGIYLGHLHSDAQTYGQRLFAVQVRTAYSNLESVCRRELEEQLVARQLGKGPDPTPPDYLTGPLFDMGGFAAEAVTACVEAGQRR